MLETMYMITTFLNFVFGVQVYVCMCISNIHIWSRRCIPIFTRFYIEYIYMICYRIRLEGKIILFAFCLCFHCFQQIFTRLCPSVICRLYYNAAKVRKTLSAYSMGTNADIMDGNESPNRNWWSCRVPGVMC